MLGVPGAAVGPIVSEDGEDGDEGVQREEGPNRAEQSRGEDPRRLIAKGRINAGFPRASPGRHVEWLAGVGSPLV